MKRIIPIFIIGIFIVSGIGASASNVANESVTVENDDGATIDKGTHTVLGEYGTATWCGFCKYAHGALKELYAEGQLDFYYISHISDMNSKSSSYLHSHYNLYGYPTVWFDGGYKVNVGSGSVPAAKSAYTSSINSCLNRDVEDVDIDLFVTWISGTEMEVDCTVSNNEANTYGGTIQVAICEKESSRGWRDTGGATYTMTFLDWAFNEPLSIPVGGSWSDTITWDGASHGYTTVTKENTLVIAAAYNDEWHQGYSYPPSSNPFDAYYVDECVAAEPGQGGSNEPPNPPYIEGPHKGIPDEEYDFTFVAEDPNNDQLWYYIKWGDGQKEEWIGPYASGEEVTRSHTWSKKGFYFIEAKAKDDEGEQSAFSSMSVNIPRNGYSFYSFIHLLLERFPNLFPIFRLILK
jgi:hypothetical protein